MREKSENRKEPPEIDMSRRNALAKLGLSLFAAYAAPMVLNLNKAAAHGGGDTDTDTADTDTADTDTADTDTADTDTGDTDTDYS